MRADTDKKDSSADGIDDREECYERNTDPGEKIGCIFHEAPCWLVYEYPCFRHTKKYALPI
jgi:hypothetical protein